MASHFRRSCLGLRLCAMLQAKPMNVQCVEYSACSLKSFQIEAAVEVMIDIESLEPQHFFSLCVKVELMLSMRGTNPATVKDCKEQCLDRMGQVKPALKGGSMSILSKEMCVSGRLTRLPSYRYGGPERNLENSKCSLPQGSVRRRR